MLSAAPPPFSFHPITASPLREVQAVYRRVCVLRVSGKNAEADMLQTEKLPAAIAKARENQSVTESQLEALFAREDDRVDNAQVLAEILLPLLTASNELASVRRNFSATTSRDSDPESATLESPRTADTPVATGPLLPGIADFIDEMLTQDRAANGARHSRHSS